MVGKVQQLQACIASNARHFDAKLWQSLYLFQPRTTDSVKSLFWAEGGIAITISPVVDYGRTPDILTYLSDQEYVGVYRRAKANENLAVNLPSKPKLQRFTAYNIPALRAVMSQVLRWLLSNPKRAKNRYALRMLSMFCIEITSRGVLGR